MALPTYVGAGAFFANAAGINASYPGSLAAGDILLLFVETADQTCATPNGWTKIGEVSNTGQTRLTVFMHRWVSGTAVFVGDSGDHQLGHVIAIRGASNKPPLFVTDSGTETGAGQTQSMDGPTTTQNDSLIVIATSHGLDVFTASYSAWTNANLGSVTERIDVSNGIGNGGGVGIATGTLATAGAVGTSTVVNAQTSPAWASMVIAFAPPTSPPNDLFSNVEPLSDGLTQAVPGKTYDATTEASEDLSAGEAIDRTQWWSYDATIRQIVKYRMITPSGSLGILASFRGASVSTTSAYSIKASGSGTTAGFGQEAERGLLYEYLYSVVSSSTTYNRAQVDPAYPLLVQTARRANVGIADFEYEVEFESFTPPANDDFDDAEEITFPDLDPVDIVYDLEPATSQPSFVGVSSFRSIGDLWYHINLATTTPVGIGFIKDEFIDNAYPIAAVTWIGSTLGSLVYGGAIRGAESNDPDNPLVQRTFNAGVDYYIQIVHDAGTFYSATTAETGTFRLQPYAIPPNDNFVDAEDLGTADSGYTTIANTQGGSAEVGETYTGGYSVWYEFTPTNGGWYEFTATSQPATGGWTLQAYRGVAVNALTWVSGLQFQTHNPRIIALRGGETYHIKLDGQSHDFVQLSWELIAAAPVNDDFADATVLTGASGSEPTDIEGATREAGELDDFPFYIYAEVTTWFEWVCPSTAYYSFETSSLGSIEYQRALAVWETDTTGDPLVENIDGKDSDKAKLAFLATASETYYGRVTLGRQYPTYTFDTPYSFDLDWDTFVPATDNLFANATPIAAEPVDSLALDNYGLPTELEVDFPPALLEIFQDEEFGTGEGQIGRVRWFDFVPEVTGTYDFDLTCPGCDILAHMFIGDELDELLPVVAIDGPMDTAGIMVEHQYSNGPFTVDLVEGETYRLVVAGFLWDKVADVPAHWISQGDFTLSWMMHPEENDIYLNLINNVNNIGNLNYVFEYQYPGYDDVYGTTWASGGWRTVSNIAATSQVGELAVDGYGPVRTLWFRFSPAGMDDYTTDQGDYRIWVEGSGANPCLDPVMAVYDQTGSNITNPGTLLGSDDDTNGLYPEVILNNRFAYDPVLIQVDARDEGEFTIQWRRIPPGSPPANDDFADAIEIFDSVPFAVNAVHATVEYGELPIAGYQDGPFGSVWYKFLPTLNQGAQVVVNADWPGSLNLNYQYVDIYHGTTIENLVNITPADDYFNGAYNGLSDVIPFNVEAGETYYLRFSAYEDQAWSGVTATLTAFGDDLYAPFISSTTTLYTPSLLGQLPFIAPTTTLFAHYLSGAMDIPAPFIDSSAVAFDPYLVSIDRARLSQEPIEVLLIPDTAKGRVSQVAVEVLLFVDTAKARMSQESIELIRAPTDAAARLSQLQVEVLKRNLRESVTITIID